MKRALLPNLLGVAFSAALAVTACGDDDETAAPKPLPPPVVSIVSLQGVGGPLWQPGQASCVELGQDVDQTVVVTVSVTNADGEKTFTLRPPGTCGSTRQCGTALLRVDPSGDGEALRVQAAQATLDAKLATLGAGSHTFRVELRDKNDEPVVNAEAGAALFSEVTVEVKAPGGCSGTTDAGADADSGSIDAAPDADPSDSAASDASDASDAADTSADASTDAGDEASTDSGDGSTSD